MSGVGRSKLWFEYQYNFKRFTLYQYFNAVYEPLKTIDSTVVKPSTSDIHIVHRIWIKVKRYAKMTLS